MADALDQSLLLKYKARLEEELGAKSLPASASVVSKEYTEFRKEILPPHLSIYENLCNFCGRIFKIKPPAQREKDLLEAIETCHLKITPTGAISFSIIAPIFAGLILSLMFYSISGSFFFVYFFVIISIFLIMPLGKLPDFFAATWRLKASNQMVLCVFYVVTYMRHTSNLELALDFAAEHLSPPLSLDIKKVLWDVETERYSSVRDSLEAYLKTWKKYNMEFIESFHLIESSLFEGTEEKRLAALDKGLDLILEETYEKMLHYAHNLKSPITMLHMLGIILPILGLVILPLVVSFLPDIKWYHLATIYNLFLPLLVYIIGKKVLATRPTGYGDTDISEDNPQLKKYRNVLFTIGKTEIGINPLYFSIFVFIVLFLVGISPLLMGAAGFPDFGWGQDDKTSSCGRSFCFMGFEEDPETKLTIGPYGLGAAILSLGITLAFGVSIGLYYKLRSKNVIKIREESKRLEDEFAGALFQLGNRLGDGIPAEMAVGRVADTMSGTVSGKFFDLVSNNIRRMGMSVEQAIFDPKHGALIYFPSKVIESSMKVLTESAKKGPSVAARALMNVSRYIKEIHRVNERLKDLLADVISSMKSQIKFLAPVISGIVIGITSMITNILGKLGGQLAQFEGGESAGMQDLPNILGGRGIPTYYFQIMVGIYVVQIVYILTVLANGIENGSDSLNERYELGVNLVRSTFMYILIAGAITILFNVIASNILPKL
ncbi:MAG TPA: hypothetical protein VJI46_06275 [Candidatus Nanoarchaeia archaeon]|nr:hypothetical protein [Candidatus Nanoarchaeia archaeon]